jgi:hypothetical protein
MVGVRIPCCAPACACSASSGLGGKKVSPKFLSCFSCTNGSSTKTRYRRSTNSLTLVTEKESERHGAEIQFGGFGAICSHGGGGVPGCGLDHTEQSSHVQRDESLCLCCLLKCSCHSYPNPLFFHYRQVISLPINKFSCFFSVFIFLL